jgi:hypothetical protein
VKTRFSSLVLALLLLFILPLPASATLVVPLELDELARSSSIIAYGEVLEINSRWTDDRHQIITEVSFQVIDAVQGCEAGESLSFYTLGGSVGKLGQVVSGEASFVKGEKAVVFLEQRGDKLGVVGLGQGQWTVDHDAQCNCELARPRLEGLGFVAIQAVEEPSPTVRQRAMVTELGVDAKLAPMPLDALLKHLAELLAEP